MNEQHQIWQAFLKRWPLDKLATMTLQDYTNAGSQDSFTYWLESKTDSLGSIWGGSAFKFGIYSRGNQTPVVETGGRRYTDQYGWYSKYGNSHKEAFENVRCIVATVAQAARKNDLATVEQADLGTAVKWKIAFLYQNQEQLSIVPLFRQASLRALVPNGAGMTCEKLHPHLMQQKGDQDIFAFGKKLWDKLAGMNLTTPQVLEYLNGLEDWGPVQPPTEEAAGFLTPSGKQVMLDRTNNTPTLYLSPGAWLTPQLRRQFATAVEYSPKDLGRNNSIATHAPTLSLGHAALKVTLNNRPALEMLCDAYGSDEQIAPITPDANTPLNQILFGPPGTGKTYTTVERAVEILSPELFQADQGPVGREVLKQEFDKHLKSGRLRFVTFHQSFSYEDFVEGIRADVQAKTSSDSSFSTEQNNTLSYTIEPGIFKQLCEDASRDRREETKVGIRDNPTVWKLSIESVNDDGKTRQYCLANEEARIGWSNAGDLTTSQFETRDDLGSKEKSSLRNFVQGIVAGDIVVCLKSARTIQAVGVVKGPYEYNPKTPEGVRPDYVHKLPIHWLATNLDFDITALNADTRLTQQTVYRLSNVSWPRLYQALQDKKIPLAGMTTTTTKPVEPHVLIIDEINRGNVSRIFGELITLIEPDKRSGASESLEVTLPYSKERFSVPQNVYIIGTMNTADRSLSGLDIALRRRFVFKEVMPQPELLDDVTVVAGNVTLQIGELLRTLNQRIEALLDRDHTLGHAYFLPLKGKEPSASTTFELLADIFRKQIMPLLQEYFFDDWQRIHWVLNDHRKAKPFRFVDIIGPSFEALFGSDVALPRHRQNWGLNNEAFGCIESYSGIVSTAPQAGQNVVSENELPAG